MIRIKCPFSEKFITLTATVAVEYESYLLLAAEFIGSTS